MSYKLNKNKESGTIGYNSLVNAIKIFNENNLENDIREYTLGYVRPGRGLNSFTNRNNITNQIYNLPGFYQKGGNLVYAPFGTKSTNNEKSLAYKPFLKPEEQTSELQDFIYSDYKPNFPVVPVKIDSLKSTTPEFDLSQTTASKDATRVKTPMEVTNSEINTSIKMNTKYNKGEQTKFANDLYKLYYKELTANNIPNAKEYAEWLTAQDSLETAWGSSIIGENNFGNIQYFDKIHGNKYSFTGGTDKHKNGQKYSAKFVNFDTIEDYIKYKVRMLSNQNSTRYKDLFKGEVSEFADRMQKSGYAESQNYAKALKDMLWSVKKRLI